MVWFALGEGDWVTELMLTAVPVQGVFPAFLFLVWHFSPSGMRTQCTFCCCRHQMHTHTFTACGSFISSTPCCGTCTQQAATACKLSCFSHARSMCAPHSQVDVARLGMCASIQLWCHMAARYLHAGTHAKSGSLFCMRASMGCIIDRQ
jgi:hypothetical protein